MRVSVDHNFDTIEQEREFLRQNPENELFHYMNNFSLRLPGQRQRNQFYDRDMNFDQAAYDRFLDKKISQPNRNEPESQLRMSQSKREFYRTIDEALVAEGISFEEVMKLNATDQRRQLCSLVLPAYFRLRKMGYKRYPDLIA